MQVVPVAAVDQNILLAVPFSSWHRKVAKRTLPSNFLQKPTLVEVVAVSEDDMDTRDMKTCFSVIALDVHAQAMDVQCYHCRKFA